MRALAAGLYVAVTLALMWQAERRESMGCAMAAWLWAWVMALPLARMWM